MSNLGKIAFVTLLSAFSAWSQASSPSGPPAKVLVTISHHYGHEPPAFTKDDVTVTQRFDSLPVTRIEALRGDRAGLELYLLVDNCSNCEAGPKYEDLRKFIDSQPQTTRIGVAYIESGRLEIGQKPTQDRERVVKALNAPAGSKPASPFNALSELIQNWPQSSERRAVLMISNGIDPSSSDIFKTGSSETAIETAQRNNVTVYAIYNPSADYLDNDPSQMYVGQMELAHLAVETGGEAYFMGFGPLPSLVPFLADIADHSANQYWVEFLTESPEAAGSLVSITVKSKNRDLEIMAPTSVWVPAAHKTGGPTGR